MLGGAASRQPAEMIECNCQRPKGEPNPATRTRIRRSSARVIPNEAVGLSHGAIAAGSRFWQGK